MNIVHGDLKGVNTIIPFGDNGTNIVFLFSR